MIRLLGKLLMVLGFAGFCTATAWWYLFFEQMLGDDVKHASECFYRTTDLCKAAAFADLVFEVPAYEPAALWISGVVFVIGLLVWLLAPR